ncbi:MAG: aspartate aminotransferase family protein [Solirubrobacterales bacterium]
MTKAPSTSSYAESDLANLVHPLTDHSRFAAGAAPLVIVRGEGCELIDEHGRRLLDGSAGLWTVNLGHGREDLVEAARSQMSTLAYAATFGGVSSPPAIALAERIVELAPPGLGGVFFVSGGSEANETAIKLARRHWVRAGQPEKSILIAHDRGYHGLAGMTTTATRLEAYHGDFGPAAPGIVEVSAPYTYRCDAGVPCDPETCPVCTGAALESRIREVGAERVAAVIVEPVFGAGGVIVPPAGFLRALRAVCDRNEVLLIVDEVITGFGRTGSWFASGAEGVSPDLITFAKGVSSGYVPLGGVLVSDQLWDELRDPAAEPGFLMHGFTHSGHPVACAVGLANLAAIEREGLIERVGEMAAVLADLIEPLRDLPEVGEVRQAGLMVGVELVADKETRARFPSALGRGRAVADEARERGMLTRGLLDDIVCLAPPFTISPEELERAVAIVADSIAATRHSV